MGTERRRIGLKIFRMGNRSKRLLVIGLDCATPQFVFGPERFELPNLARLMSEGCWGPMQTCHPPITVPAWAVMMSSKDPGTLGVYGFRNRADYSYNGMTTANAAAIKEPRLWDILSQHGKKSVVLAVPQTYPVKPVNGWLVGGFLTPDTKTAYTYPKSLKTELEREVGEYIIDVKDFRTEDRHGLLKRIYALMENRFAQAEYLIRTRPWDFFMMVEMGVDRLHHAFWRFTDPSHPLFEPDNEFRAVIRDYYQAVDRRIGNLLQHVDEDTAILVVSDHGARAMHGGVCLNEWLMRQGYLVLQETLEGRKRIEDCSIDWSRTRAWGSGGYYGRIFFNVEGREPNGVVPAASYEAFRSKMIEEIEGMKGPDGSLLGNKVYRPQELYANVRGIAPDLFVYFGNLAWRSVGSVGFSDVFTFENDTGPDDANHDFHGIFILRDASARTGKVYPVVNILDIAPTLLDILGVPIPSDMQGRVLQ